ncbi:MAG: HlyD family secretion protein [Thiohalomonadales bacterium]
MSETGTKNDAAVEAKETSANEPVDKTEKEKIENRSDPVKRITKIVLVFVSFLFVWYVMADRLAPWTDQARIQAYVIPIVPEVAGRIRTIDISQNQIVKAGQLLLEIDPQDYELALERAESDLELAGQDIGADTASVATAQSKVVVAEANLNHMLVQSKRVYEVVKRGVMPKFEADKADAAVKTAKAEVASAKSELAKAKSTLGKKGEKNPKVRAAIAALKQAQLNLQRTEIFAPSDGGITNLNIDVGHYAKKGTPVMTFISIDEIWIQANLRENSVANIKPGNEVDIALDVAPGRIFKGKVSSVGFAIKQSSGASNGEVGDLANIEGASGWLRDAQRFPVLISFSDNSTRGLRRLGGQADVQIYTGNNWIINALGWVWIRVLSWLSYIY